MSEEGEGDSCVQKTVEDGGVEDDKTELMVAAESGNLDAVRCLVESGADVNAANSHQITPLMYATSTDDNFAVVQFLVERGARVNAKARYRFTPLMGAAETGDIDVVRFLVERGAHVNVTNTFGETALMRAAKAGKMDVVQFLVESGANVNAVQNDRWTSLLYATRNGHRQVAGFLIENGAAIEAAEENGRTPLMLAARKNDLECVRFLVEKKASIDAADNDGQTSLMHAARKGNSEVIRFLVGCGASVNAVDGMSATPVMYATWNDTLNLANVRFLVECGADVNARTKMGETALMSASRNGDMDVVRFLVECGADVNARTDLGETALMSASRNGDMDVVRFLVESGADVNAVDNKGWSPLVFAVGSGKLDVAGFLIEAGADSSVVKKKKAELLSDAVQNGILDTVRYLMESGDANATDEQGKTLLMIAAQCSQMDVVRFLVDRGADLNAVDNLNNSTPLLYAAEGGHLDVVQFLIQRGADVNIGNKEGVTSLLFAVRRGMLPMIRLLIEAGADVNIGNKEGDTPLLFAVRRDELPMIRLLIEAGADVNAADNWGRSSLFYGAVNSNLDVIQLLVESGADINAVDSRKNTPLMIAARRCCLDGVQFLVNCGADVNAVGDDGLTPLMLAADQGKFDVFQYLVQHGADVRAVDKDESTMLMHAAMGGSLNAVELAFKNHADVKTADKNGWTPLMYAVKSGKLDAVRFLLEKGAGVNTVNKDGKTAAYIASGRGYTDIQSLLMQFKPYAHNIAEKMSTRMPANCIIPPFEVKLNQLVGAGNTGGDYRAKWLDADVAVRLFVPDATMTTFADEVAVWHQLRHPNVIKLYGACNIGHHFFVCEWASNGSLVNFLSACEKRGEPRRPWKFLHEAALGLAYLHERKIVHGNLCSNSILIGSDGLAKLADFGVSGSIKDGSSGYGSVRWQSPEQLRGEEASFASDIYSFCLCAVEAVTRKAPWDRCGDELCKRWKEEWDAVTHPDGYFAPVLLKYAADLCMLASKMCGNDPRTRVSAVVVVQMLERLAAQEAQDQQRPRPKPEPLVYIHEYDNGELLCQWQKLRDVASHVGLDQPHVAVVRELEALYENLGKESRHPKVLEQFYKLVMDCFGAIDVGSLQNRILRLSATRAQGNNVAIAYRHIDAIWAAIGDARSTSKEQKLYREEKRSMQMQVFVSEISQTLTVLDELKTENERNTLVAILKAEINFHGSAYSAAQMAVLKKAYADITARLKSNTVVTTPKWFLPWHELEFDGDNSLAVGGFGTVYQAKWLESDVIVKRINSKKSNNEENGSMFASIPETDSVKQSRKETREMFEHEVEVWFGLSHPHIVRLFGACHVGNPIFVCEYASNGSLDKYLRSHPNDMWLKLYEAALGVQYLHSRKIVHGDLKCNNIVVGRDNKAKVTDFGLSSANVVTGAWRWVAPECLKDGPSALSLASDVYALGMCVVEAMRIVESTTTNQQDFVPLPWGGA
ncbi:Serine/threonine protein kinase [Phytophthora cinnamomi]|uniref:Serine/threonine protein kinase n=1 Tax=Phytophthora cinnamomi TaxID=4785 RepID=UPI003559F9D7|nr:Serine/threonine protein kinase [Phytophthora cinnamomi]